ncbi:MAG: MMPL family transporter, partial [Bacteroidota bacterium]|nr:MMPL family transporter [Bacteroidota bacterium]
LPEPKGKHTEHLDRQWMFKVLDALVFFATQKRKQVYLLTTALFIAGIYGMSLMHTTGNIVDDLPNDDLVVKDLKFFEEELNGVLPFEIILNFNSVVYDNFSNIAKIQQLQEQLKSEKYLSKSLSIVDAMKFISQSYANGKKSKYDLDFSKSKDQRYFSRIINSIYFKNTFSDSVIDNSNGFVKTFLDSNHKTTRITMQIADIGTAAMDSLISRINTCVDSIVNPEATQFKVVESEKEMFDFYNSHNNIKYMVQNQLTSDEQVGIVEFPTEWAELKHDFGLDVFESAVRKAVDELKIDLQITGTGVMYAKGTTYLVNNLFISLMIAIVVVALLMSFLFRSLKMVLVSLLPNLLPLIFTSALMGYFGIPIKPSTILVFSIAFGISIDDTIHFLAKYRQELKYYNIRKSVETSIRETGVSMIYTSIILFFGFSIFTASNFGGTQALGLLVSLTLFVAMLTNLVLLPSLLLSLEKRILTQNFKESEDHFQDDQDIEWNKL